MSAGAVAASTPSLSMARAIPHSPESLSSMSPMDLFVSQISCETSLEARVDAMHRLKIVADAMGTDAVLSTLIPFLSSQLLNEGRERDEEDEILLLLGEKLGQMVPDLIPGPRALPLLPILEKLAGVEETVVRDKAVESMNKIVPLLPNAGGKAGAAPAMLLLQMGKRLASADWFTAKVSAAGVLPTIYEFVDGALSLEGGGDDEAVAAADGVGCGVGAAAGYDGGGGPTGEEARRELRALYKDLSEDDTPMVRRSAAKHLGRFVEAVAGVKAVGYGKNGDDCRALIKGDAIKVEAVRKAAVLEDCVPVFQDLSKDEQDSVRLLAVASAGSLARALGMDSTLNADLVLPIVRSGCVDLSWRVRHNLAKEFSIVASSLGFHYEPPSRNLTEVFLCYSGLLQDTEAEVRSAAVGNVALMTILGGSDLFVSHVAPTLPALAADNVMEVRSRLAQTMMDCCGLDNEETASLSDSVILQVFKPLLEGFLNDEFAEVQLHVLSKLSRVSHLLSKMDVVVSSILQMTKAPNWRVREAVGHLLPHLAEAMGVSFFKDHLLEPWLKLLLDQVADVRTACVTGMSKLYHVAGAQWIQTEILPHYRKIYEDGNQYNYLTRITVLRCYANLVVEDKEEASRFSPDFLEDVVGLLLDGLVDRVANVRMVSARGLARLSAFCEEGIVEEKVRPALRVVANDDSDDDCRYFANLALESYGEETGDANNKTEMNDLEKRMGGVQVNE